MMMDRRSFLLSLAAGVLARALAQAAKHKPLPYFVDATSKSGIHFRHQASRTSQKYLPESMGAGVAMFDYDNNGYQDLFFVNGAKLLDPVPRGVSPDKSDPRFWNRMYHNNGNGTFTDVTAKAGVGGSGWCAGACFLDYDRDGLLDLIVTRYLDWDFATNVYCGLHRQGYRSYCHPDQFSAVSCLVFHNNGNGTFTDVSKSCGIALSPGKALGIAMNDFDRDGWPDVFVANDSFPQQLFRNNRNGTFSEVALERGLAYDQDGKTFAGMGADFADYDNDGWPDVFVNALANQRYALFRNSKGSFDDVSDSSGIGGITMQHSGWGTKMLDYDNDGWRDVFVAQGHVMDNIELTDPSLRYREPLLLMKNTEGKFRNVSNESGAAFQVPLSARGAAFGDLDNDGFIDIAINCNDGPAIVLRNQGGNANHWLLIHLVGSVSNRDGFGAAIRIVPEEGPEQYALASSAGSYLSASDKRVHFGLGTSRRVRLLEINWPSGIVQRLNSIDANQIVTVHEPGR